MLDRRSAASSSRREKPRERQGMTRSLERPSGSRASRAAALTSGIAESGTRAAINVENLRSAAPVALLLDGLVHRLDIVGAGGDVLADDPRLARKDAVYADPATIFQAPAS